MRRTAKQTSARRPKAKPLRANSSRVREAGAATRTREPAALRLRKPRALRPGGTIGIAAPAGPIDRERLEAGAALWRAAGFRVLYDESVLAQHGYLAGDDAHRAQALMTLVDDPDVDAIVCARGGYGCHRIISRLDAKRVRAAAKPLVGYSDVTTLLLWQRRCAGLIGFHAPMLERGGAVPEPVFRALREALAGGGPESVQWQGRGVVGGVARGRLTGGSLATLVASLGTPWEIDLRDAIFLFEDVNEPPYRIDRMLAQLVASGALARVAGIGVGQLVDCTHARHPVPTAREVVIEKLGALGRPMVLDLPFGHGEPNLPWPVGARARLDGDRGRLEILEQGVVPGR